MSMSNVCGRGEGNRGLVFVRHKKKPPMAYLGKIRGKDFLIPKGYSWWLYIEGCWSCLKRKFRNAEKAINCFI